MWRVIFIEFCSYIFWAILADLWRDGKEETEYAKSGKYRADTTAPRFPVFFERLRPVVSANMSNH